MVLPLFATFLLGIALPPSPPQWAEASREAKPWTYNWWMASAVDRRGLEAQCAAMEEAGFGGFHVIPIYGAKGFEPKTRPYLSPAWMQGFGDAVEIAARQHFGDIPGFDTATLPLLDCGLLGPVRLEVE